MTAHRAYTDAEAAAWDAGARELRDLARRASSELSVVAAYQARVRPLAAKAHGLLAGTQTGVDQRIDSTLAGASTSLSGATASLERSCRIAETLAALAGDEARRARASRQ